MAQYSKRRFHIIYPTVRPFLLGSGLVPGQRYRYRVFSIARSSDPQKAKSNDLAMSEAYEFHYPENYHLDAKSAEAGRSSSSSSSSTSSSSSSIQQFLVFSDIGVDDQGGIIDSLLKEVKENPPVDMMLAMGDYGYDLMTIKGAG